MNYKLYSKITLVMFLIALSLTVASYKSPDLSFHLLSDTFQLVAEAMAVISLVTGTAALLQKKKSAA